MSDIGSLSYEYARANELAEKLRAAIEHQSGKAKQQAWEQLSPLLSALLVLLDPLNWEDMKLPNVMEVPTGLARRLRNKGLGGRSASTSLRELVSALAERKRSLNKKELQLLEELLKETRFEISEISRRMFRR